jgi:hypothetical protein
MSNKDLIWLRIASIFFSLVKVNNNVMSSFSGQNNILVNVPVTTGCSLQSLGDGIKNIQQGKEVCKKSNFKFPTMMIAGFRTDSRVSPHPAYPPNNVSIEVLQCFCHCPGDEIHNVVVGYRNN